jgi:hypothetical protein
VKALSKNYRSGFFFLYIPMKSLLSTTGVFSGGRPAFYRIPMFPVTQGPGESFENGAVPRRRDHFNKYFRYEVSEFQIAGVNIVVWRYIGFVCIYISFTLLNIFNSKSLLAFYRFVIGIRIGCGRRQEERDQKSVETCQQTVTKPDLCFTKSLARGNIKHTHTRNFRLLASRVWSFNFKVVC